MPASGVERIHGEFTGLLQLLTAQNELSLLASADDSFRKILLLSAGSYFEYELTTIVTDFVVEISAPDSLVAALVKNKAISRQYHTWFEWEQKNANRFFAMFGEPFKKHMGGLVKSSSEVDGAIKAFLEIGEHRNRLVHQNLASFVLEKTADEIFALYTQALPFIDIVGKELRSCSKQAASERVSLPELPA